MKKLLFLATVVIAAAASCSKSEVINAPGAETPISFNPYTGRTPATKATVAGITDLAASGFQVYAFMDDATADGVVDGKGINKTDKPYMDKVVKGDETGVNWTYSGNIYWPASNYLDFVAYGKNASVVEDTEFRTKIYYTIPAAVSAQQDLLVAAPVIDKRLPQGEAITDADGLVNLTFSHLLSRIGFSLVTEGEGSTLVTLTQVDLVGNFYTQAEVDLTQTKETELKIGEDNAVVKANRPYVSPKAGTTQTLTTYSLLGAAIGTTGADDASFTSAGSAAGVPVFNNSASYDLKDANDKNKVAFVANEVAESETELNNRYMMVYPMQDWGSVTVGEGETAKTLTNAQLVVTYFLPKYGEFETITIDLVNATDKTPIKFDAGKSYEFKFKVSTYEIGFEVTVEAWDTATGVGTDQVFVLC